jgi:hypothetical protein
MYCMRMTTSCQSRTVLTVSAVGLPVGLPRTHHDARSHVRRPSAGSPSDQPHPHAALPRHETQPSRAREAGARATPSESDPPDRNAPAPLLPPPRAGHRFLCTKRPPPPPRLTVLINPPIRPHVCRRCTARASSPRSGWRAACGSTSRRLSLCSQRRCWR